MTGETDLGRLMATLCPALDPEPYGFVIESARAVAAAFALIREAEGTTVVARLTDIRAAGYPEDTAWARITLQVQSSLQAVGLTAAISGALAAAGISANVIAAFHHDYVFVPWDRRDEAVKILRGLQIAAQK